MLIECYSHTPEIRDVMHSSATRVLYTFGQTPSLHVRERELGTRLPIMIMVLLARIIFMHTDYPSGASVQQPPVVKTQADVDSQSSTFSKDMSSEQLALWLRNNPSLSGAEYEQDISKLRGTYA